MEKNGNSEERTDETERRIESLTHERDNKINNRSIKHD